MEEGKAKRSPGPLQPLRRGRHTMARRPPPLSSRASRIGVMQRRQAYQRPVQPKHPLLSLRNPFAQTVLGLPYCWDCAY